MKPVNHQKTPTTIGETPSNNKNNKKEKMRDRKGVCVLEAGYVQHTSPILLYTTIFQNPNQSKRNFGR